LPLCGRQQSGGRAAGSSNGASVSTRRRRRVEAASRWPTIEAPRRGCASPAMAPRRQSPIQQKRSEEAPRRTGTLVRRRGRLRNCPFLSRIRPNCGFRDDFETLELKLLTLLHNSANASLSGMHEDAVMRVDEASRAAVNRRASKEDWEQSGADGHLDINIKSLERWQSG
jgi:hypothetical protein